MSSIAEKFKIRLSQTGGTSALGSALGNGSGTGLLNFMASIGGRPALDQLGHLRAVIEMILLSKHSFMSPNEDGEMKKGCLYGM